MKFLSIILFTLWLCVSCGAQEPTPAPPRQDLPRIQYPGSMSPYGLKPALDQFRDHVEALEARPTFDNLITASHTPREIQQALDKNGFAYLLPGVYTLTQSLTLPRKYGCALIGLGGSLCYVNDKPISPGLMSGGSVVLKWAGDSAEPMIRVLGAEFRLDGLNLIGGGVDQLGVLVENGESSTYAVRGGKGFIPSLTGCNLDAVIQFGLADNGDNGDVTSIGRITGYDCNAIVRVSGGLGFEIHVGYARNARCKVVFDCQAGGGLHCYGGQTLAQGGTLLRLGVVNPDASTYRIQGWHVDSPAAVKGFKLLECTERSWADVTIQAHLPQKDYPTPIAELIGPVSLTLNGCSNLRPESIHGTAHNAGAPVVIADGCRLRGDWSRRGLLTGAGTARMRDCFDNRGVIQ